MLKTAICAGQDAGGGVLAAAERGAERGDDAHSSTQDSVYINDRHYFIHQEIADRKLPIVNLLTFPTVAN